MSMIDSPPRLGFYDSRRYYRLGNGWVTYDRFVLDARLAWAFMGAS